MEMHDLIRQMDRSERMWPDDRPWSVQVLASYLHIQPTELLNLFKKVNPAIETERDQVLPEDLRLLKAFCERSIEKSSLTSISDKRKEQAKARKNIKALAPKIAGMVAKREHTRALNSFIYLLGESGEYALPEEKAHWYEEMGRLCLKIKRHPNEAARYFRSAIYALSILEDTDGIQDLLETYEEDFIGDAQKSWLSVSETGQETLEKLSYSLN